jgi:hypothetical protein
VSADGGIWILPTVDVDADRCGKVFRTLQKVRLLPR